MRQLLILVGHTPFIDHRRQCKRESTREGLCVCETIVHSERFHSQWKQGCGGTVHCALPLYVPPRLDGGFPGSIVRIADDDSASDAKGANSMDQLLDLFRS